MNSQTKERIVQGRGTLRSPVRTVVIPPTATEVQEALDYFNAARIPAEEQSIEEDPFTLDFSSNLESAAYELGLKQSTTMTAFEAHPQFTHIVNESIKRCNDWAQSCLLQTLQRVEILAMGVKEAQRRAIMERQYEPARIEMSLPDMGMVQGTDPLDALDMSEFNASEHEGNYTRHYTSSDIVELADRIADQKNLLSVEELTEAISLIEDVSLNLAGTDKRTDYRAEDILSLAQRLAAHQAGIPVDQLADSIASMDDVLFAANMPETTLMDSVSHVPATPIKVPTSTIARSIDRIQDISVAATTPSETEIGQAGKAITQSLAEIHTTSVSTLGRIALRDVHDGVVGLDAEEIRRLTGSTTKRYVDRLVGEGGPFEQHPTVADASPQELHQLQQSAQQRIVDKTISAAVDSSNADQIAQFASVSSANAGQELQDIDFEALIDLEDKAQQYQEAQSRLLAQSTVSSIENVSEKIAPLITTAPTSKDIPVPQAVAIDHLANMRLQSQIQELKEATLDRSQVLNRELALNMIESQNDLVATEVGRAQDALSPMKDKKS